MHLCVHTCVLLVYVCKLVLSLRDSLSCYHEINVFKLGVATAASVISTQIIILDIHYYRRPKIMHCTRIYWTKLPLPSCPLCNDTVRSPILYCAYQLLYLFIFCYFFLFFLYQLLLCFLRLFSQVQSLGTCS